MCLLLAAQRRGPRASPRQIRHQLLGEDLRRHEEEHGPFSDKELAEARAKIFGSASTSTDADAA
ncbi:hypothetical protein [Streptomyces sp. NPDC047046]|uniref:hypothetical protein n=1 Tax=Streptomyces sp. NPDC047046 TaxID=3155378 RepID=UPI0033E8265A